MIRARDVQVTFSKGLLKKKIKALDGFTIDIEKGDIFGLLGPNGAGKSTAMYCFLGLIKPDRGTITVFGVTPEPGSPLYEKVAYVPEEPHFHLYLTVEEAIRYYASLYRKEIPGIKIKEAIERVELTEFRDLQLAKCSKGMKQKVGIAICLVSDADVIFLDEPTRGLDPIAVREFRNIILEKNRQGSTIVMNSHILSEVELICNRAAIINRGKVVVQDELKNLMKFDLENYIVEFELTDALPDFITEVERTPRSIKGMIPTTKATSFFAFANENRLKVYECSLKKLSLEDAFFNILKGTRQE